MNSAKSTLGTITITSLQSIMTRRTSMGISHRVRKDMLRIDNLLEECRYLKDNHIQSREQKVLFPIKKNKEEPAGRAAALLSRKHTEHLALGNYSEELSGIKKTTSTLGHDVKGYSII